MKTSMQSTGSKPKRKGLRILGIILVVLVLVLVINHDLVRIIFYNFWDPQLPLHVENWTGGTSYTGVQYSAVSENDYLNLYVPDSDTKPPLMVLVHGGGFIMNDLESRQAQLFYQYFRDHGYACATINYRLAQEAKFPAAVQDVRCAVRYLRANADRYGYDADQIIIWGESAGGYLAVMAGVTAEDEFNDLPFIGEEDLAEPVSGQVSVILDYYGAVKLESWDARLAEYKAIGIPGFVIDLAGLWLTDAIKDLTDASSVEDYWIGASTEDMTQEELNQFTPAYYIKKNCQAGSGPDVIIWHGDADLSVPYTQSEEIQKVFDGRASSVALRIFHNAKHAGETLYSDAHLAELEAQLEELLRQ